MISTAGPKVLEFNCRLGDQETQPLMMRLRSDLYTLLLTAARGDLLPKTLDWDSRTALCVVLAAAGYPEHPLTGDPILGLDTMHGNAVKVFHAGTATRDDTVITAGGRVLGVTALGDSLTIAQQRAYAAVANLHWPGLQYRQDIGHHGLRRS